MSEEIEIPETEKKTRVRVRPTRIQLQQALDAATEKGLSASEMKLIATRIETLSKIADREQESDLDELTSENQRMKSQITADATEVESLKQQISTLGARLSDPPIKIVTDPEVGRIKELNSALVALAKFLAGNVDDSLKAETAIRVIQGCPPAAAKFFVPLLGLKYEDYAQMLSTYRTEAELFHVIDVALCDGPAVVFARAALAVNHGCALSKKSKKPEPTHVAFVPDMRTAEEKLAEAKRMTRGSVTA